MQINSAKGDVGDITLLYTTTIPLVGLMVPFDLSPINLTDRLKKQAISDR